MDGGHFAEGISQRFRRGAFSALMGGRDGEVFAFSYLKFSKVPCEQWSVVRLLRLTVVAILLPWRRCGSLGSALGPAARHSCVPLEPATSLYTAAGRK